MEKRKDKHRQRSNRGSGSKGGVGTELGQTLFEENLILLDDLRSPENVDVSTDVSSRSEKKQPSRSRFFLDAESVDSYNSENKKQAIKKAKHSGHKGGLKHVRKGPRVSKHLKFIEK